MFRGCRRWVYSLVCAFCILSMLFLDTCTVNAQSFFDLFDSVLVTNYTKSNSIGLQVVPTSNTSYQYVLTTNGSFTESGTNTSSTGIYRGSGSFTFSNTTVKNDVEYYQLHFKVPYSLFAPLDSGQELILKDLYCCTFYGGNISSSIGSIQNFCFTDGDTIFWQSNTADFNLAYKNGYEILNANASGATSVGTNLYIEFDYLYYTSDYDLTDFDNITTYISFTSVEWVGHVNQSISSQELQVYDSATKEELDTLNETQEDTNTKITDFFGSFFDNLLHIFVPEDGYFSTWFDKVNTLLSAKLGMLYAPFDLVISTLQAIYSSSTSESGIPFPGIKWEDTWLVEPFTFTFASLGSNFDDLREKVYFATDTVLVFTFLMLLQSKVKLILEGHE